LKTRYLAMACITSVMLGVATLIVVNSVMSGFSTKLRDKLHSLCSDVLIEAMSLDGFSDPNGKMERIWQDPELAGKIEAMTPTLEVFALLQFKLGNETITRMVTVIGVDPIGRTAIGGFSEHLERQKNLAKPSFEIPEFARQRYEWQMRMIMERLQNPIVQVNPDEPPPPEPYINDIKLPRGIFVGNLVASFREKDENNPADVKDVYLLNVGDPVVITTVNGGQTSVGNAQMRPVNDQFVVVDYFKSEMSEYDSKCVFVPLDYLQHLRTMEDRVSCIQIKLKENVTDTKAVVARLKSLFSDQPPLHIVTWEEKQGPILKAIAIERGILNVLLFMIVGVAGFGILAIFSMIVAEKTKDIGILKALGASNSGIMAIFVGYGWLLGIIGTFFGTGLGVWLTSNINGVEQLLSRATGQHVFNPEVYYFKEIPTDIQLLTVLMIDVGAVLIAVVFSVLPALRAAMLQPVRALRYE
jgi:lipoprotein-releasing system permease protein